MCFCHSIDSFAATKHNNTIQSNVRFKIFQQKKKEKIESHPDCDESLFIFTG